MMYHTKYANGRAEYKLHTLLNLSTTQKRPASYTGHKSQVPTAHEARLTPRAVWTL
jgi:hypothetical protein